MVVISVVADSLQGMMYANDPAYQIEEDYMWLWALDTWGVFLAMVVCYFFIFLNMLKCVRIWKQLLQRH